MTMKWRVSRNETSCKDLVSTKSSCRRYINLRCALRTRSLSKCQHLRLPRQSPASIALQLYSSSKSRVIASHSCAMLTKCTNCRWPRQTSIFLRRCRISMIRPPTDDITHSSIATIRYKILRRHYKAYSTSTRILIAPTMEYHYRASKITM